MTAENIIILSLWNVDKFQRTDWTQTNKQRRVNQSDRPNYSVQLNGWRDSDAALVIIIINTLYAFSILVDLIILIIISTRLARQASHIKQARLVDNCEIPLRPADDTRVVDDK